MLDLQLLNDEWFTAAWLPKLPSNQSTRLSCEGMRRLPAFLLFSRLHVDSDCASVNVQVVVWGRAEGITRVRLTLQVFCLIRVKALSFPV